MGCGYKYNSAGTEEVKRKAECSANGFGIYKVKCPVCGDVNTKESHCSDFTSWDLKTNEVTFKRELARR